MSIESTFPHESPNSQSLSNSSFSSFYSLCQLSVTSNVIFTLYTCTSIFLLLPLFIFIIYMGFQWWNHQRSMATGKKMSHSDFFTYQMMIMEISGVLGSSSYTIGSNTNNDIVLMIGLVFSSIILPGQTLFHLLTCVERYLAVVHPVTYMQLRDRIGVRIRNISTICIWLLCLGWMCASTWYSNNFPVVPFFSVLIFCVVVMLYCCVSVLFVLIRPGPGKVGGKKEHFNSSKKRAFQMIATITGTLMMRCVGLLFWFGFENLAYLGVKLCVLVDLGIWMTVPSSLVLPLLYLHRAGKLTCYRQTAKSGE